jgi:hypothetical protein
MPLNRVGMEGAAKVNKGGDARGFESVTIRKGDFCKTLLLINNFVHMSRHFQNYASLSDSEKWVLQKLLAVPANLFSIQLTFNDNSFKFEVLISSQQLLSKSTCNHRTSSNQYITKICAIK